MSLLRMISFHRICRSILVLFLGFGLISRAAAADDNSASGTLAFDGKPTAITQVRARQIDRLPGEGYTSSSLKIMFADRAMSPAAASSEEAFKTEANAGAFQGFLIEIDIPTREWLILTLHHPQGSGETRSGGVGPHFELANLSIANGYVSGRVRTLQPVNFEMLPEVADPAKTYAFDVTFRARIGAPRKPSQILTGAAARISPQADAAVAQDALLLTGDIARIRAGLRPDNPLSKYFADDASGRDLLNTMNEQKFLTAPNVFRAAIIKVIVFDDFAIIVSGSGDDQSRESVSLVDGSWRVAAMRSETG